MIDWWTFAGKERLVFRLCCLTLCCRDVLVPFRHGVWGRKWNSSVSVLDHSLSVIYFKSFAKNKILKKHHCSFQLARAHALVFLNSKRISMH